MINHFKLFMIIILIVTCFSITNIILGNDQKKELKYEDIDWEHYHWWEKWYDFNPEVNYPESPKVAEYLKIESEGTLPKYVHIYRGDPVLDDYRNLLMNQRYSESDVMYVNIMEDRENIIKGNNEFDEFKYEFYTRLINPRSMDFLLWIYKQFKNNPNHPYKNPEGLCIIAFWMMKDPDLFKEELLYFKKKVVPVFWERIKTKKYDIWILDALYRLGYEKEVLPIIIEQSKTEKFEYQLLCTDYFSFKKNLRIAVAKKDIEQIVLKLLNNLDELCWDTQYECILFLYLYGDLDQHIEYLFKIIDMKRYYSIDKYMDFFELIPKNEKVKKYFESNLENREFSKHREKMIEYINSFPNHKSK